ncbi:FUSC family protein [Acidisoma sp. C75]
MAEADHPPGWIGRAGTGIAQAAVSVAAAVIAYEVAAQLHLVDGFWSSITAIAVTQTRFHDSEQLGQRQLIGAAVGGCAGILAVLLFGTGLWVYAAAVLVAIAVCALIGRSDSGQLAGITATIILLVPHAGSAEQTAFARLAGVAIGALTGVIVSALCSLLRRGTG